jgi:hypothetical protein
MSVRVLGSLRRAFTIALLGAFVLVSTAACFGSFSLSRRLHSWNAGVSANKWVRQIVFLGTVIIPIRAGAALIDMLFTNAVEFWTGRNPLAFAPGSTRYVEAPNGESATMTLREDGLIDVVVRVPGQPDQELVLVRNGAAVEVYAAR